MSDRIQLVGLPSDGEAAISAAGRLKPHVNVLDVIMPPMNGIHTCCEIMDVLPYTRVVMMTASNVEDAVVEAIAAAATRYLEKYSRPAELLESVVCVPEGRLQLPEEAMKRVLTMFQDERMRLSHRPLNPLTDLERETLIRVSLRFLRNRWGPSVSWYWGSCRYPERRSQSTADWRYVVVSGRGRIVGYGKGLRLSVR